MLKKIAFLLLLIAPMSVFAQKFAHFKSMDIIPVMPEYAKAQTDIQTMQKQYEDEIKRASDEFNKKYAEYQQEQKNLPQNIQERRQKEIPYIDEAQSKDITNDIKTKLGISLTAVPATPAAPAATPAQ